MDAAPRGAIGRSQVDWWMEARLVERECYGAVVGLLWLWAVLRCGVSWIAEGMRVAMRRHDPIVV